MKNEINAVLENMTTTIPEPEDYTGEDGLLYCGKCRKPKEAYFAPDKAAIFGRDRHPAECDCQRTAREEREAAEKRRRHLDTVEELKRRGFTDPTMRDWTFENDNGRNPQTGLARRYVEHWEDMRTDNIGCLFWGGVGTGKGPAYERWAKVYNLKQMAAALQYLQEHHLTDYAALTASTEAAVDHFHKLSDELRTTEEALSKTSELMAATVDYAKTRPVFDGYKAARYSKKYLAQHEAELATYRAAKDTMNTILNGAKLPKIEALKKSRRELAGQKKELYAEYREAQRQMREAVAIKANIDHLLGITDERENKAQER